MVFKVSLFTFADYYERKDIINRVKTMNFKGLNLERELSQLYKELLKFSNSVKDSEIVIVKSNHDD